MLKIVLLLTTLPLAAQAIRLGPEHVIPSAIVDSAPSRLIALLPHGDALVAFWGRGGPLHATLLDRQGKFISDTVIAGVPIADTYFTWIAQAGNGYLVIYLYDESPPTVTRRTGALALDFDFRVQSTNVDLAIDFSPSSVACNDSRCAVVLNHFNTKTYQYDDRYVMLLRFDSSIAVDRLPLPQEVIGNLTAMPAGFLTLYRDANLGFHSALFDTNGVVRNVHDYGKLPLDRSFGGATATAGGAIVVWPQDETLHAARLDANGAVLDTRTIATFTFFDFGEIAVSCSTGECTAGVEWYYTGYVVFEGVFWPVAQIHAVRFAESSLDPIDRAPVTIAIPPQNAEINAVATPSGTLLAWSAFKANSVRVAFLGRGTTPYAGDPAIDGRPIIDGLAWVRKIAAAHDAIAWTDFAIDGLRNIRLSRMDDEGVPSDPPEVLEHDFFSAEESPCDVVAAGEAGPSRVIAWQNDWNEITAARAGDPERMTGPGNIVLPMISDGRESLLVVHDYLKDSFALWRFGATGQPAIASTSLRWPVGGAMLNGKLFLQAEHETRFIDLDKQTFVSTPTTNTVLRGAFVFGDRSVTAVLSYRDPAGNGRLGVQRFAFDGQAIDAQPLIFAGWVNALFAVPLGRQVLIVWDESPHYYSGGPQYAAVFDPETRTLTTPSVISTEDRLIYALLPRDALHAIIVFRKTVTIGDAYTSTVSTQRLEVTSGLRRRAIR